MSYSTKQGDLVPTVAIQSTENRAGHRNWRLTAHFGVVVDGCIAVLG